MLALGTHNSLTCSSARMISRQCPSVWGGGGGSFALDQEFHCFLGCITACEITQGWEKAQVKGKCLGHDAQMRLHGKDMTVLQMA